MKKTLFALLIMSALTGYALSVRAALAFGIPDEPDVINPTLEDKDCQYTLNIEQP